MNYVYCCAEGEEGLVRVPASSIVLLCVYTCQTKVDLSLTNNECEVYRVNFEMSTDYGCSSRAIVIENLFFASSGKSISTHTK